MAFEIKNPPEFTLEVEQWTRETDADGSEMAKGVIEPMLNNEVYLKSEMERQEHTALVTLRAAGWTGSAAPYTQTVQVPGAREGLEPMVVSALADGASPEAQKNYIKAYGILCSGTGVMGDGTATFKVYKKPGVDITIGLRGVRG